MSELRWSQSVTTSRNKNRITIYERRINYYRRIYNEQNLAY